MKYGMMCIALAFCSMGLAGSTNESTELATIAAKLGPKVEKMASEFKSGNKQYCATGNELVSEFNQEIAHYQDTVQETDKGAAVQSYNYFVSQLSAYGLSEYDVAQIMENCGFLAGDE